MLRIITVAVMCFCTPAMADDCFQIVTPIATAGSGGVPPTAGPAIKINRCTGETWMLNLVTVQNSGAAWHWTPIGTDQTEIVWPWLH
jgi:hypothetical protein